MRKIEKMIAPIAISITIALYYLLFFGAIITTTKGIIAVIVAIIPLLLLGTIVKVCFERIREIEEGEDDDLSQY